MFGLSLGWPLGLVSSICFLASSKRIQYSVVRGNQRRAEGASTSSLREPPWEVLAEVAGFFFVSVNLLRSLYRALRFWQTHAGHPCLGARDPVLLLLALYRPTGAPRINVVKQFFFLDTFRNRLKPADV